MLQGRRCYRARRGDKCWASVQQGRERRKIQGIGSVESGEEKNTGHRSCRSWRGDKYRASELQGHERRQMQAVGAVGPGANGDKYRDIGAGNRGISDKYRARSYRRQIQGIGAVGLGAQGDKYSSSKLQGLELEEINHQQLQSSVRVYKTMVFTSLAHFIF